LQACDPPMPPTAYNRVADNWRPLFAIAHTVGGDWPALALEAYRHLTNRHPNTSIVAQTSSSAGSRGVPAPRPEPHRTQHSTNNSQPLNASTVKLLNAIRQVFAQSGTTRMTSKQLVESLRALADPVQQSAIGNRPSAISHQSE